MESPLKVQLNSDVHIDGNEALAARASATISQALERFSEQVTRVEVHVGDENGGKSGRQDQRCMLEARIEGRKPVAVTEHAATLDQAVHRAAQKMARRLGRTFERLHYIRVKTPASPLPGTAPEQG